MRNIVIGISGKMHSGKDTAAGMMSYMLQKGDAASTYSGYVSFMESVGKDRSWVYAIHFADGLKDALSGIYPIPRWKFDDPHYKDEVYYNLVTNRFDNPGFEPTRLITEEYLKDHSIADALVTKYNRGVHIKLRLLMQYFGTEMCRRLLGNDVWIKTAMDKAKTVSVGTGYCLMPDVRFEDEAEAIRSLKYPFRGFIVGIRRDTGDACKSGHASENCGGIKVDYEIDNNSSYMLLFYKILDVCRKIHEKC